MKKPTDSKFENDGTNANEVTETGSIVGDGEYRWLGIKLGRAVGMAEGTDEGTAEGRALGEVDGKDEGDGV